MDDLEKNLFKLKIDNGTARKQVDPPKPHEGSRVIQLKYDATAKFKEIVKTLSLNELITLKVKVRMDLETAKSEGKTKDIEILTKKLNNVDYYIDNIYYQQELRNKSRKTRGPKPAIHQSQEDLELFYTKLQNYQVKEYEKINEADIGLKVTLLSHQQYGVSWMYACENSEFKGGIFADDMGLGKTLTALSLIRLDLLREANPKNTEGSATLIVCPNSLLNQWENEATSKFLSSFFRVFVYHGTNRFQKIAFDENLIVLTTPGIIVSEDKKDGLLKHHWRRIIIDEGHLISNHKTKIFKALLKLKSHFKWILSGTPVQNSLEDLASFFSFLQIKPWTDPVKFKALLKSENPVGVLSSILPKMFLRRTKASVDPKTKQKLIDLPEKEIVIHEIEFQTQIERDIYMLIHNLLHKLTQLNQLSDTPVIALTMRLRLLQACSNPLMLLHKEERDQATDTQKVLKQIYSKYAQLQTNQGMPSIFSVLDIPKPSQTKTASGALPDQCALCLGFAESKISLPCCQKMFCKECLLLDAKQRDSDLCPCGKTAIEDLCSQDSPSPDSSLWASSKIRALLSNLRHLPPDEKSLVYSQWTSMLDSIEQSFIEEGIQFCRLDGTLSPKAKQQQISKFKNEAGVRVFLISLKAGSVGLNLVEASRVFMMDLWWNPQVEEQAFDRVYRIGQKRKVKIIRFVVKGTWEKHVLVKQEEKKGVIAELFAQTNFKSQAEPLFKFKAEDFLE